ncbi:hypothetical protein BD408DRAFT_427198, partial [Parasitella parasitica]
MLIVWCLSTINKIWVASIAAGLSPPKLLASSSTSFLIRWTIIMSSSSWASPSAQHNQHGNFPPPDST